MVRRFLHRPKKQNFGNSPLAFNCPKWLFFLADFHTDRALGARYEKTIGSFRLKRLIVLANPRDDRMPIFQGICTQYSSRCLLKSNTDFLLKTIPQDASQHGFQIPLHKIAHR